jgi:hypothetical protein
MLAPILSVWMGQELSEWSSNSMLIQKGDTGENVKYWQSMHNAVRHTVVPAAIEVTVDGDYGDTTAKAFADFVHKQGGQLSYTGLAINYWTALRYQQALAVVAVSLEDPKPVISEEQIAAIVNDWLTKNLGTELTLKGTIEGKVTL